MTAIDDLPPLRDVIRRHGLSAKKSLGQNFLLDLNLTARIARAGGPINGVTVVEIGPGPGGLTRALVAEGADHVIAIERDHRAIAALGEVAAHYPGRLTVIEGDALERDWTHAPLECAPAQQGSASTAARIVANLPYNIATALLVRWLQVEPWPPWYDCLILMFQREVAERIVAPPGSKAYGRLAVLAGWRTEAKIMFDVAPSAFVPPPKVTSSVVRLLPRRGAVSMHPHHARTGRGGGFWAAPQNAAAEFARARVRPAADPRGRRHRTHGPRRRYPGGGFCRARQCARRHGRVPPLCIVLHDGKRVGVRGSCPHGRSGWPTLRPRVVANAEAASGSERYQKPSRVRAPHPNPLPTA